MENERNKKKRKRSANAGIAGNTSSASPSASGRKYEVFLSFGGKDTRYVFTDHLYNNLDAAGIHTFRDNNELRVGEEIGPDLLKAIKDSKISIPIFSEDYASSKWCLKELAQMVQCKRTMRQKILPIFYHVKPSDVKYQTGSYEAAFRKHEKRFDEKTVQEWKEALREVGELKGWELKEEMHEGELVKKVVEHVLLELQKNDMVVTDNLVGIDHHEEEMMRRLNVDSNDERIVGIHGMGGIGKTTIAKFIYNKLKLSDNSERFECCCFLVDVRETSQQGNGLVNLQKQLISKIQKGKCLDIANDDDGINMIKRVVWRKKVLIVLDDVDDKFQFEKLAGKRDWYGSGSRIIVTTRNKEVLDVLEVDETYEPPSMEFVHSLQLFCKHAFKRDFPPEDYANLSKEVVSTCDGLPLALEIIGSSLFRKEKEVWEDTSRKLKEIPNDQVHKKLRISYDTLNNEQKQIFLDIACLFIGIDKSIASYMWEDCKFYPKKEISVLVLRSLVKIGDYNELRMHDQLRDLGREIVREENYEEPEKRSRLWDYEEALDTLEGQKGTEKVVALCLDFLKISFDSHRFTNEEFRQLQNLRFLQVDDAELDGDFKNLLPKLRWLRWNRCPRTCKLTNFHMKNLVILDLSCSDITDDWETWNQIKMAKKLKVLNLSYCTELTRAPDFSTFATLEMLILNDCYKLVQIDSTSICGLSHLKTLNLDRCRNLQSLPGLPSSLFQLCLDRCESVERLPDLSNLKNLSELKLLLCCKLMEIPGLGKLESLTRLDVSCCLKLAKLDGLEQLESLRHLRTSGCESLERLPDLSNLKKLRELFTIGCKKLAEIQGLDKLESLEDLNMEGCICIKRLPDLSSSRMLKKIMLCRCENLAEIEGHWVLKSLERLDMSECESLESLPSLLNLGSVKELKLTTCSKLVEIQGLGKLELLTSLDVSHCEKLAKLDGLEQLESLRYLETSWCASLERLPDLSNLKKLRKLSIEGCKKLIEIHGLDRLEFLEDLSMDGCISIERSPGQYQKLAEDDRVLKSLKRVKISWGKSFKRLPDLSNVGLLKELNLIGKGPRLKNWRSRVRIRAPFLARWAWLAGCCMHHVGISLSPNPSKSRPRISHVNKKKKKRLHEVEGLGVSKSSERLDVLERLSNFGMLQVPMLSLSLKLAKVEGLEGLKSLERLIVSYCALEIFPDLLNLGMLKELKLVACDNLTEVEGLRVLPSLERLEVSCCDSLERLSDFSNLNNLKELQILGLKKLTEIRGLGELESIEVLKIFDCELIEKLPDLSNLQKLEVLDVSKCVKLTEIRGLEILRSLEYLDTNGCKSIKNLPELPNVYIERHWHLEDKDKDV